MMIFKAFKPKIKIFGIALLAAILLGSFGVGQTVSAMDGDFPEPPLLYVTPKRVRPVNPFIDIPDLHGWTLLMYAIQNHNSNEVSSLLQQGASLFVLPPSLRDVYSNAFEYLCDLEIGIGRGKCVDGEYENQDWFFSTTVRQEYYKIVNIILIHCAKNKIRLSVNSDKLEMHDKAVYTIWKEYGNERYGHFVRRCGLLT